MKNLIFIITAAALWVTTTTVLGQGVANYTPTRATGITYNSISSTGNSVNSWRHNDPTQMLDDNRSNPIPIGFDFWYDGARYTTLSVGINGIADFSSSAATGYTTGDYDSDNPVHTRLSSTASPSAWNCLALMYGDLTTQNQVDPLGSSFMYVTTGSAPNRVLTVEWINLSVWNQINTGTSWNFQLKLYESTGTFEFIYGNMTSGSAILEYKTGFNAPDLSGGISSAVLMIQQTANSTDFQPQRIPGTGCVTTLPESNSKLVFTSVTPANPSNLSFSALTQTSMTLNWTDNANNEVGYVIYNSLDGINYTYLTQLAANSNSYLAVNLIPGTMYYWKVYAVSEGHLSISLDGLQATNAATDYTTAQSGNWNTGATWVDGAVPAANSNITIANTHTVTINTSITVNNITVGGGASGILQIGSNGTPQTLNVLGNITVNTGGQFIVNAASGTSGHILNLSGNILNNGTFDLGPSATTRCQTVFNRTGAQTISGIGTTTRFYLMRLNMGLSNGNVLDVSSSNFSTQSTGFLTIANGTFKYSAPSAITPFATSYTIPSTGGLWINNSLAVATTTGGNLSLTGFLRVTNGTLNVGTAADQQLLSNGGDIIIEGGTVNVAGSFNRTNNVTITKFAMAGGTLRVASVGSTSTTLAPFMMDISGSSFTMSGGGIVVVQEGGTGTNDLGYINTGSTTYSMSGGMLQIGDNTTPVGQTMQVNTNKPVFNFTENSANATAQLVTNNLTVNNNLLITAGTLDANDMNITVGGSWTNQGTFNPGTGTVTFSGSAYSAITKATGETFHNLTIDKVSGDVNLSSAVTVNGTLNFTSAHNVILNTSNLTLVGSVSNAAAGRCIVTNSTGGVVHNLPPSSIVIFPVGTDATHYNPVTLTSDASHVTDNLTVSVAAGAVDPAAPNNNQAVQATWNITEEVVGGSSVIIDLGWDSSQHGIGFSTAAASLWHYDTGSSTWQDLIGSTVIGTDPYTLSTAVSVSSFSPFCVGNSGALPVEMTSFTATSEGLSTQLRWTTATEVNSYNFEIERRLVNTDEYIKVGTVEAVGTSNAPRTYEFNDVHVAAGRYIYRLKMNDIDGSFTYFGNAEIAIGGAPKEFSLKGNYPNPFNPSTTIEFTVPENGHVMLRVYNVIGQHVATLFNGTAKAEQYTKVIFDASQLSSGIYFSVLEFGNQRLIKKMMLTK